MQINRLSQRPFGHVPVMDDEQFLGQVPLPSAPRPAQVCPPSQPAESHENTDWAPRGHELFDGSGTPIFGG